MQLPSLLQVHARAGDAACGIGPDPPRTPTHREAAAGSGAQLPRPGDGADLLGSSGERLLSDVVMLLRAAQGVGVPSHVLARAVQRFRLHLHSSY